MPHKSSLALSAALGSLEFPITKEAAIARIGDRTIPTDHGVAVSLADLLRGVAEREFEDYLHAARLVDERWSRLARNLAAVEAAEAGAARRRWAPEPQ